MRKFVAGLSATAIASAVIMLPAGAAGPFTLFGEATLTGGYLETVSDASPGYGGVSFATYPATFADLTQLSTDFNVTDDNCGGGSPRFQIKIDKTGDNVSDGNMFVYLGPAGTFTGCAQNTWTPSGNLIGNNDACRWDTSQLAAGTVCNTHTNALAMFGTGKIMGINLVIDSGWSAAATGGDGEQTVQFDNTQINADVYPYDPVPANVLFWNEEDTTQVKVDWKAVSGASSYTVYHSSDNVTFTEVFSGNALTFTHTVATGSNNYYKVTASNATGESASGSTIAGKFAGTKDIVIDDGALASDFNANGTATPSAGWTPYHVNDPNAYVQDVLSYTVGGDNYSVPGAFAAQTFDWTTSASLNGYYDVFVAYICDPSRGTASYNVYSGASQVNSGALTINQSLKSSDGLPCGPQTEPASQPFWKKIGNFAITGAGRVQLASATGDNIVADAVAFHKTGNIVASSSSASSVSTSSSSVGSCSAVSSANLVGHWKLDENSGLTAVDSAGGDNNGTLENGPAYVSGTPAITPNPSALSFDGTDDQVRIANSGDFRFGTGAFTVSAFTKGTVGDRSVLGNFSNTQRGWGLYHYASERINFFGYGNMGTHDTSFAAPGLLNGQWHHVAGVYTRSGNSLTIKTFFDGALIGTHTVSVGDITSTSDLLLGKYLLQPNYAGSLDDVRVYARALTDGEVDSLSDGCAGSSSSSVSSVPSSSSSSSVSTSPSSSSVPASSSSSSSAVAMCNGMTATIYVKNGKVVGGPQNGMNFVGTLNGTAGADVIVGTSGPDNIFGKGGADTICGGAGPDNLSGDGGADWINGEAGPDKVNGGDQGDFIVGGPDGDNLKGDDGTDTLCGGDLGDLMDGGDGADKLDGAAGNDSLKGGNGSDACHRGEGHNSCESIVVTALPACVGF